MSNQSLVKNIKNTIESFKANKCDTDALISSIESNGSALENMPYDLIQEIDKIEFLLTESQFGDEFNDTNIEDVIKRIEIWLNKIPI